METLTNQHFKYLKDFWTVCFKYLLALLNSFINYLKKNYSPHLKIYNDTHINWKWSWWREVWLQIFKINNFFGHFSIEDGKVSIDIHCKKTDINQYLLLSSCHPKTTTQAILYSISLQIIRQLTESIPNWPFYPHLGISYIQLGIIYPIGD